MKKTNFSLGIERNTPLSTTIDTYRKNKDFIPKNQITKDFRNSVVLGNSPLKWESSYANNFYEKYEEPIRKKAESKATNFVLGHEVGERKSLAQDSYVEKKYSSVTPPRRAKLNNLYIGEFKDNFETMNSSYGKTNSPVMPTAINFDKYKDVQFSLGNDPPQYISKFKNDYGEAPPIIKRERLIEKNKICNIVFGDNKFRWKTTYKDLNIGK